MSEPLLRVENLTRNFQVGGLHSPAHVLVDRELAA